MTALLNFFNTLNSFLWGWPTLIFVICSGMYFTLRLRGLQFRLLIPAVRSALSKDARIISPGTKGSITNFQALMTALSSTVGTGNIVGVATAVAIGGPGALFWMWMAALLGMATKYCEALLGVHFREYHTAHNTFSGGPMYYIAALPWGKWAGYLAKFWSITLILAALFLGNMLQSNSVADAMYATFEVPPYVSGVILTALLAVLIFGGIKRIGRFSSIIAPFMIALYLVSALYIIATNITLLDDVFALIFKSAFTGMAATGGFLGATLQVVIQKGLSRGVFSNEAGLGSAAIPAAVAATRHPTEQALISMTQTFIDTLIVCTLTGVVIILTGVWQSSDSESIGAALTAYAFAEGMNINVFGLPLGSIIVTICTAFFAFSTLPGWTYYGEKGAEHAFGEDSTTAYKIISLGFCFMGAWLLYIAESAREGVSLVWAFAEAIMAFMIFPNLIALICFTPLIIKLTNDYLLSKSKNKVYTVKPFANE